MPVGVPSWSLMTFSEFSPSLLCGVSFFFFYFLHLVVVLINVLFY